MTKTNTGWEPFTLSSTAIDTENLRSCFRNELVGALCIFEGWVRNHHEGRKVIRLEYEAYEALAVKEGLSIIQEAYDKFPIQKAVCCHRTGVLDPGEIAIWVGVSAAHRKAAYDSNFFILEEVKSRVPIWKKEWYQDGSFLWVDPTKNLLSQKPQKRTDDVR